MKSVLITGTNRGIGKALAKKYAAIGFRVFGVERTPVPGDMPDGFVRIEADLTSETDLHRISRVLERRISRLDTVVHNAGVLIKKEFAGLNERDFQDIFRVNVFAVAELTRVLLPFLQNGSTVMTISSVAGLQHSPKIRGLSAYAASKAAIIAWTESMDTEFRHRGIRFISIAPGGVQTRMFESAFPGSRAAMTPEEVAEAVIRTGFDENIPGGSIIPVTKP